MSAEHPPAATRFPRIRAAVAAMRPYVPGTSLEHVQRELGMSPIKMNQNENPLGASPRAVTAATEAMAMAHLYPDGATTTLRRRLAALWRLPVDWFFVGNGSDEVFRLLAEIYLDAGDRVVVPAPTFAGYRLVTELMGAELRSVPLRDSSIDLDTVASVATESAARIVFLCRPNNPTGTVFTEGALRSVLPAISPDTLVVLDEAYREFDGTSFDSRALLLDFPNLIVTRTFSKIYGLAGLRLGYGIMSPEFLAPFWRARDPFSVNLVAAAAGLAALDDADHLNRSRQLIHEGKRYLAQQFDRLGIEYVPSEANFLLFHTSRPATDIYEALLRRGVLVRPCTSFGLDRSVRITIGTERENSLFVDALEAVLQSAN